MNLVQLDLKLLSDTLEILFEITSFENHLIVTYVWNKRNVFNKNPFKLL